MVNHDELRAIIYKQLERANAELPGIGKGKFSKDLAKMIEKYLVANDIPVNQEIGSKEFKKSTGY